MLPSPVRHIIFDRDGTLNVEAAGGYVLSADALKWEARALDALGLLSGRARLSIATNQSCVGRGLLREADLFEIHRRLVADAREAGAMIEGIYVCPHAPDADCSCRKPKPGLLVRAANDSGIAVNETLFVGDSASDIAAAIAAGMQPILIRTGKGRDSERTVAGRGVPVFDDLMTFAEAVVAGMVRG